jgi:hypothetical protein
LTDPSVNRWGRHSGFAPKTTEIGWALHVVRLK